MININVGHNTGILEKCPPLKGYVREYQGQKLSLPEAIDKATERCIREEGRYLSLQSLMQKALMPLAQAMDILDFSKSERAGYEAWMNVNKNTRQ